MESRMDIKGQSVEELKATYHDLCREIYHLKNELSQTRKLEKPHMMSLKKRDRARVLTVLQQKGSKVTYEE
ncbi:MAG: 50S ribosomal protein L29 [Chlamydiae bacterium]|nr:50S ribosomal protein L29 [Chlamydiota bacterium]